MEPLVDEPEGSFDLIAPPASYHQPFSLEGRSEMLFSRQHLANIFANSSTLLQFTAFLSTHRPQSVPILIYYLDALKALKALAYANAVMGALQPIPGQPFSETLCPPSQNLDLDQKAARAFQALADSDVGLISTMKPLQLLYARGGFTKGMSTMTAPSAWRFFPALLTAGHNSYQLTSLTHMFRSSASAFQDGSLGPWPPICEMRRRV